ncbi:MAG: carbamate kinase [Polyangiaceae bacterium]|nr:carbamate kinase [Polyangiaceae bacterium]
MSTLPGRDRPVTVVAFGGNALLPKGAKGTKEEQIENARHACAPLVERLVKGDRLLLVFGNGPQVGHELLRSHAARADLPSAPLDVCVASTQGTMGFFLELAFRAELVSAGVNVPVTSVLTLVRVDRNDPAFHNPDKPVGPFYDAHEAERLHSQLGWVITEDSGRGYRHRVASPKPLELVDAQAVHDLLAAGHVVVAGGGGGIPVVREPSGELNGVEAVIDKDRTAALLGLAVGAVEMIDLTGVDCVYRKFTSPSPEALPNLTVVEARKLQANGEFPAGSMGPKMEAAIDFLEGGGKEVLITSMPMLSKALHGQAGTRITS